MSKKDQNFLDYIPAHSSAVSATEKDGRITVHVENTGFFNRLAQKCFKAPVYSDIDLDDLGSFVWKQIDGQKTVFEIAADVKEAFGDKAEPLYDRLSKYVGILHEQKYVVFVNENKK